MRFRRNISGGFRQLFFRLNGLFGLFLCLPYELLAQGEIRAPVAGRNNENIWLYGALFVLGLALAAAFVWMFKTRKKEKGRVGEISQKEEMISKNNTWETSPQNPDKQVEISEGDKKTVEKSAEKSEKEKNLADGLPKTGILFNRAGENEREESEINENEGRNESESISGLPVFKIQRLEIPRPLTPLPISDDEDLMSAVEQVRDELEADEEVRELAVRILARFKTRNSIEALSEVALHDVSSNLRSKAVSILVDLDHESVFETILLACADPAREVRAAAARGLFRLSGDRADAWTRIAETGDELRMRRAALAAKEADLVKRSFARLVHPDQRIAYEAVTLIVLMIRAGETEETFSAFENHHDNLVQLGLLHVIGLTKNEKTLSHLYELLEKPVISKEMREKINQVIQGFKMIPA